MKGARSSAIAHEARALTRLRVLLDLVFALSAGDGVFYPLLRFGFFHGALGFGGALGAAFGTLLALLVDCLFATQQFDERSVGAVAFAPSRTDDAQISAVAITKAGTDGIK